MADPFAAKIDMPYGAPDERRGLLIVADDGWFDNAGAVAAAAGLRLLDVVPLEAAPARLDIQIDCDVVLLCCQRPGILLERLMVQIETIAIQNNMAVILLAGIETLDLAYACVRSPRTQLLCNPDNTDLAAALLAASSNEASLRNVNDAPREGESNRLDQLSQEVSRLARTIESLTTRSRGAAPSFDMGVRISDRSSDYIGMPALSPIGGEPATDTDVAITAARVRDLLRARRMRADFLAGELFADPAWDMLLDLMAARLEHERVSVSSLCIASAVPPTTALRWIRTLTDDGLVVRQADPHDGRRIFIALADSAADALTRWFTASRRYLCC
ncbi:MarR family transcriptional regulator [Sphingobium sp. AN558]|uniref:MarR family transcriptional regulator n=1 Tax=Sphingobium sp. AN558 TaxID=3133442 RepID=UPI0030BDF4EC